MTSLEIADMEIPAVFNYSKSNFKVYMTRMELMQIIFHDGRVF